MYNNPATPEWLAKRFRANKLAQSYLVESGKKNIWEMPEFETARSNVAKERDLGMEGLTRNLTRSGVEGPSAALSLEKYGNNYSNRLLDLANSMREGYTTQGLNVGGNILDQGNKEKSIALNWQQGHDARAAQPNDFMKTLGAVKGVTSIAGDLLGGAGMMGMLPGMKGISMASGGANSGLNGMNFMALLKQLFPQLATQ